MKIAEYLYLLPFIIMLIIVFVSWFRGSGNIKRTILYTAWSMALFALNMPNFFEIVDGSEIKYSWLKYLFSMAEKLGIFYSIISNIILAIIGIYIGNSWEKSQMISEKEVKKRFDDFTSDASELKIIGKDLNFLGDENYNQQCENIRKLGDKARLLCEQTDVDSLIKLYHTFMESGNQIRYYTIKEGIANLKAQIKMDTRTRNIGLFATRIDYSYTNKRQFELTTIDSGYLLQTISKEFDHVFSESLNPVIKCIALDLGGVYFDGDIDDFYEYIKKDYGLAIHKNKDDKLNIDNKLMLGEISIKEFIKEKTSSKYKCNNLTEEDWENILHKWGNIWKPNEQMKKIFEYIGEEGIYIVPFSNLDIDNGNKYLREHYLPSCCTEHFFSYEQNCSKPSNDAFEQYFDYVKKKFKINYPFQILLIDDQEKNISKAREHNWEYIKYITRVDKVTDLIFKLKEKGILPQSFSLN